jgi:peptide deformylase
MPAQDILRLGNQLLYQKCSPVEEHELPHIRRVVRDLHDTLVEFRASCGPARAIAAPQIGVLKRVVYKYIDHPVVYLNPVLTDLSPEMYTIWDDCMSFPELLVRVRRHRTCTISYRDLNWKQCTEKLTDFSELLQHEVDHLDGTLAISRAIDNRSIILRSERAFIEGAMAND